MLADKVSHVLSPIAHIIILIVLIDDMHSVNFSDSFPVIEEAEVIDPSTNSINQFFSIFFSTAILHSNKFMDVVLNQCLLLIQRLLCSTIKANNFSHNNTNLNISRCSSSKFLEYPLSIIN